MSMNPAAKNNAASYISAIAKPKLPAAKAAAVPKMVQMIQKKKSGGSY